MKCVASQTVFWYLTRRLVGPVLAALAIFTLVDVLGEGADRLAGWFRAGVALDGFGYLALRVPFMVSQLIPVAILGGVMFAFAMLHRAEEVTALQALGVSRTQIGLPVFVLAVVASLANFTLAERVVPITDRRAHQLLQGSLRRGSPEESAKERVWLRTRAGFLTAARYDRRRQELQDVMIFDLGAYPRLHTIVQADSAVWNGHEWVLSGTQELGFKSDGSLTTARTPGVLDASPADLNSRAAFNPDELSLSELNRLIAELARVGFVPAALQVMRALKFALPASALVMAALGLAGSLEPAPRRSAMGARIAYAIGSGVGYWILLGFTVSLGKAGVLWPWPAAWLPNLLFGMLALALFLFGEEKGAVGFRREAVA